MLHRSHMSRRATVLVVDDDADVVETMVDILRDEGHDVRSACNGREALALVERERPDLVLLDLEMPVMDGRTFIAELRAAGIDDVPIVVLSGGAADAGDLGVERVSKPLRLDTLLGLIARVRGAGA